MAEKIRPELTGFLVPSEAERRILVVESLSYLPRLREMFPNAALMAVAEEAERFEAFCGLGVRFHTLDYLSEPLPFEKGSLDYILSDLALEAAGNPQDIAAGFSTFLKETGSFLTSFRNIRHWSVLEDLMRGHYYSVAARLYALPEFETLLSASYYKNFTARPQRRPVPAGNPIGDRLRAAGALNLADVEAEFYLVKADRSMPELAILKELFSAKERRALSRLLHRIEYGVAEAASVASFWSLYARAGFFPDYIASFVNEAVFHQVRFYRALRRAGVHPELVTAFVRAGIAASLSRETAARLSLLLQEWEGRRDG